MKKLLILSLVLAIALISCKKAEPEQNEAYEYKNVPSKFVGSIPASITDPALKSVKGFNKSTGVSYSYGYQLSRAMISMNCNLMAVIGIYSIMVDSAINGLTPSANLVTGKTIVFTQAMKTTLLSKYSDFISEADLPVVGTSEVLPPFYYRTSTDSNYNYEVSMSDGTETLNLFWSSDKNKVKFSFQMGTNSFSITYNNTTKTSKLSVSGSTIFNFAMQEDTQNSAQKGVYFYFNMNYLSTLFTLGGYADNLGGYIKSSIGSSYYQEGFNGTGQYTMLKYSTDNVNWINITSIYGSSLVSGYDASYAAKYDANYASIFSSLQ